jgi:serine/threonine protein kinase
MATRREVFFDSEDRLLPAINVPYRKALSNSLDQVLKCSDTLFLDFLNKCFMWDPKERLTPSQGLSHPWIMIGSEKGASIEKGILHLPKQLFTLKEKSRDGGT